MSRAIATMAVALSMSLALAACGGSAATTDNSGAAAQEGGEAAKAEQKGNNWMSADDLQALLESDYDYVNDSELSNMDDENDKIHRESIENEDGTVRHFVDINYDGKTKRRGNTSGKTAKFKKAYVQLTSESADIELFEGL